MCVWSWSRAIKVLGLTMLSALAIACLCLFRSHAALKKEKVCSGWQREGEKGKRKGKRDRMEEGSTNRRTFCTSEEKEAGDKRTIGSRSTPASPFLLRWLCSSDPIGTIYTETFAAHESSRWMEGAQKRIAVGSITVSSEVRALWSSAWTMDTPWSSRHPSFRSSF